MSDTAYDTLVAAGAPELPEGYFYRVHRPTCIGTITVDLRQHRKVMSRLLSDVTLFLPSHPTDETPSTFLAKMCRLAFEKHSWESTEGVQFDGAIHDFVGDHP